MTARTAPYGTWRSPIDAATAATHDSRPDFVGAVGDELWWTEARPAEAGRTTLMRCRPGRPAEPALPAPWNVRSRVIEYGGLPWAGVPGEAGPLIVFIHFADQRLYALRPDASGARPRPLTPRSPVGGGLRWVDPRIDAARGEVWCVLEEFTGPSPTEVRRVVAAVPLDGSADEDRSRVRELTGDRHRFVTGPRLSPDGRRAVWIAWDHPDMPWDATEVEIAEVSAGGELTGVRTLMGRAGGGESIAQAEWGPDGTLYAVTDRGGWWNLHRVDPDSGAATALCPREEEFAGPAWRVGQRWFAPLDSGLLAVLHGRGAQRLAILDPAACELTEAPGGWSEWAPTLATAGTRITGVAATARTGYEVVDLDTATGHHRVISSGDAHPVDPAYLPRPAERTFTGPDGREIHANLYHPGNPDHVAPPGEPAPYAVWVHGGPTSRAPLVLDLEIAYFTSRGIGVAEVNHGGSTGYGRAYRERLREQWGVVDVQDCVAVAEALAAEGTADRRRLAIRGGSAGGWTTAAALTSVDTFACGVMRYPVLDPGAWADGGTHDFESRYLDSLIGPLAEVPERYRDRSPVHRAGQVTAPFLILQGLDDVICPPAQCERFLAAVADRHIEHEYLTFDGEGHGFRRPETVAAALEAELSLYGQVFGFTPPDVPRLELTP